MPLPFHRFAKTDQEGYGSHVVTLKELYL